MELRELKIGQRIDLREPESESWIDCKNFVRQIMRSPIVWSWGPEHWTKINNALTFNVNGYIHRGGVMMAVNGRDLFDIILLDKSWKEVKHIERDVYLEDVVMIIDGLVETKAE